MTLFSIVTCWATWPPPICVLLEQQRSLCTNTRGHKPAKARHHLEPEEMAGGPQAAAKQRVCGAEDPIVLDRSQRQLRVLRHLNPMLQHHAGSG